MPKLPETHKPSRIEQSGWDKHHQGKTTTQKGYGHAWRKLRDSILRRDLKLCQSCLRGGRYTAAREVDHIIPKAKGGTDHPGNLEAICKPCHKAKTVRDRTG